MRQREAIAVTGAGAVSSLGRGVTQFWSAVESGRRGFVDIHRFPTSELGVHIAALIPELNRPIVGDENRWAFEACLELATEAGREALEASRIAVDAVPRARIGLVLGCSVFEARASAHSLVDQVGVALGADGPRIAVVTACASSTQALGIAKALLDEGECDVVLAGGADILTRQLFAGFHALGVLSPNPCTPFSESLGTTLGEGAGLVVLERLGDVQRRGAPVSSFFLGSGSSNDGYHETSPDPTGSGVARALRGALSEAGVAPSRIEYANVHGTGTATNDEAEARGYREVFGVQLPPMSASKSFLGHAQSAAGILEVIVTIESLRARSIPPTMGFVGPRRGAPLDVVAGDAPRRQNVELVSKTSSAFGGVNSAVVIGRHAGPSRAWSQDAVWVLGVGSTESDLASRPERLVRGVDLRTLDASSRFLTVAVALALKDAEASCAQRSQQFIPGRETRERIGLVVGATHVSKESAERFEKSARERGAAQASVSAFARLVLHATTGSCSKALGILGPTSTLSTGPGSGLFGLVHASMLLATRSDAELIVAGAVDEVPQSGREREGRESGNSSTPLSSARGAALVLGRARPERSRGRPVRVAAWCVGGAKSSGATEARAIRRADLTGPPPTPRDLRGDASGDLVEVIDAIASIQSGRSDHELISASMGSASIAIVLSTG
ncbi:MAG: hypothetical protein HYV07_16210 [Deltaproteobacteria bacterium]|nr:hypothetical protein [Deltaproteobacteria bacterium]